MARSISTPAWSIAVDTTEVTLTVPWYKFILRELDGKRLRESQVSIPGDPGAVSWSGRKRMRQKFKRPTFFRRLSAPRSRSLAEDGQVSCPSTKQKDVKKKERILCIFEKKGPSNFRYSNQDRG